MLLPLSEHEAIIALRLVRRAMQLRVIPGRELQTVKGIGDRLNKLIEAEHPTHASLDL